MHEVPRRMRSYLLGWLNCDGVLLRDADLHRLRRIMLAIALHRPPKLCDG